MQSLKTGFLLLEVAILFPSWYLRLCGAVTPTGEEWHRAGVPRMWREGIFLPLLCWDLRKEITVPIYHLLPGPLSGSSGHTRCVPAFLPWAPSCGL